MTGPSEPNHPEAREFRERTIDIASLTGVHLDPHAIFGTDDLAQVLQGIKEGALVEDAVASLELNKSISAVECQLEFGVRMPLLRVVRGQHHYRCEVYAYSTSNPPDLNWSYKSEPVQ